MRRIPVVALVAVLDQPSGGSTRSDARRAGEYTVVHSFATGMAIVAIAGVLLAVVGLVLAVTTDRARDHPDGEAG